jgi:hypothetical protein
MSEASFDDLSRWAPEDAIYEKFFAAIEYGIAEDVKLCLEMHEINVNLLKGKYPDGITALRIAAGNGNVDVIELLLENGANVDELDLSTEGGGTALHQAAYHSQIQAIRLLVDRGAKMEVCDVYEVLPLHAILWYADVIESKHREAIKFLVERRSDLFAVQGSSGETVVSRLIQYLFYFTDCSIVHSSSEIR